MITAEQKELIVKSYAKTFDKEMAYIKVGLSKEQFTEANNDEELQERLKLLLISEREDIISKFRTFQQSEDDKISYQATCKLAEVLYPDFFKAKEDDSKKKNPLDEAYTKEEIKRLAEEYGLVITALSESDENKVSE